MTAPILNLTQHAATADQAAAGVIEQPHPEVKPLLNFTELPTLEEIQARATQIATIVANEISAENAEIEKYGQGDIDSIIALQTQRKAMIAGAPFFMSSLEEALKNVGITPVYAFSVRESVEVHNEDGSVSKQNVFKHIGFVEV